MESKLFHIDDLKYLESDLNRDELIWVVFLLYGGYDGAKVSFALGELLKNQPKTDFLRKFANSTNSWKSTIIEALGTIKAFECIKNLGISMEEAKEHMKSSSIINKSIKLLYQIADACPKDLTLKFISYLKEHCPAARDTNESELEIYFLHCIVNEKINVTSCEFSLITNFFERNEKIDEIEKILQQLPARSNVSDNSGGRNFPTQISVSNGDSKKPLDTYKTQKMLVLIINQQSFYRDPNPELSSMLPNDPLKARKGTARDLEELKNLFKLFNYDIIEKCDLTHFEILQEIFDAARMCKRYDGLIVSILSHGCEGLVYGSNSIPVPIKEIKETMVMCLALLNKPKIIFIQACQGTNPQRACTKPISQLESDSPMSSSTLISGSPHADFLLFWSTVEKFASFRDPEKGTWFIQELVKKIHQLHDSLHLQDICTAVKCEVSKKRGEEDQCQIPKLETTFLKLFKFPTVSNESHNDVNSSFA